jgi:hypothetical protein
MEVIKNHIIKGNDPIHKLVREHLAKSKEYHVLASHILKVTYPEVKEPKLLLNCLDNVFLSAQEAIVALLTFCRHHGLCPPFHKTFESQYMHFGELAEKFYFEPNDYSFIEKLKDLLVFRKESPVEFSRNGDFILCSDSYNTVRVDHAYVYEMIQKARKFEQKMGELLNGYV